MAGGRTAKHNARTLLGRLSKAGFPDDFARRAVLPDWWDESCVADGSLLADLELRIARFIGVPVVTLRDPGFVLSASRPAGTRLRKVSNVQEDRLAPAIHAAIQISGAVLRSLKNSPPLRLPPSDAMAWRTALLTQGGPIIDLRMVVADLWQRGIPVIHIEHLPSPKYQGLAHIIDGRPVIVIGHGIDAPGYLLALIAHEVGHLSNGDCDSGPVVDEDEEHSTMIDDEMERAADRYSLVVSGVDRGSGLAGSLTYRQLATQAEATGRVSGVDPGVLVHTWARETREFQVAQMALQALFLDSGGKRTLRKHFTDEVDTNQASEVDRALLSCVNGGA